MLLKQFTWRFHLYQNQQSICWFEKKLGCSILTLTVVHAPILHQFYFHHSGRQMLVFVNALLYSCSIRLNDSWNFIRLPFPQLLLVKKSKTISIQCLNRTIIWQSILTYSLLKRQDLYILLCFGSELWIFMNQILRHLWVILRHLWVILRHSVSFQLPQNLNIYTQGIFTEGELFPCQFTSGTQYRIPMFIQGLQRLVQ